MSTAATLTTIQEWLRDHSQNLEVSFSSSGRICHKPTKGESREHQILDTLSKLLPTRISVERNVVIFDATGKQAPKFDGALVDCTFWPRIFTKDGTPTAMIESVIAAIEVKSSLDKRDLADIFRKSSDLRTMEFNVGDSSLNHPLVTAFAYQCANVNLRFLDFATSFARAPDRSPSLICILNAGLFGLANIVGGKTVPVDEPYPGAFPILYPAREDALLMYLYFLSHWAGMGTTIAKQFRRYSDNLFSRMPCFSFDAHFLGAVAADENSRVAARKCFLRKASSDIEELHAAAHKALGLVVPGDIGGRQGCDRLR